MRVLLSLFLIILPACAGTVPSLHKSSGIMQVHTFDNAILGPSTKYSEYYQCDKEPVTDEDLWVVEEWGKNCVLKDKFHTSTTGMFPSLAGPAINGSVAGALVGSGLRNQPASSTSGGSTVINNSCKGNCGGKK